MKIIKTTNLTKDQKNTFLNLWHNEYPTNLKYIAFSEFENYLKKLNNVTHFILLSEKNHIQGWAYSFSRDKERWFAILLDNKIQKTGYGTILLNKLKSVESKLNGWVIDHNNDIKKNGESYLSPLDFYLKNGFTINANKRLDTDSLSSVQIEWVK
jgi:hypothetical protein